MVCTLSTHISDLVDMSGLERQERADQVTQP